MLHLVVRVTEDAVHDAVKREAASRLTSIVEVELVPGGSWLLADELKAEIHPVDGRIMRDSQQFFPGSPSRPP